MFKIKIIKLLILALLLVNITGLFFVLKLTFSEESSLILLFFIVHVPLAIATLASLVLFFTIHRTPVWISWLLFVIIVVGMAIPINLFVMTNLAEKKSQREHEKSLVESSVQWREENCYLKEKNVNYTVYEGSSITADMYVCVDGSTKYFQGDSLVVSTKPINQ